MAGMIELREDDRPRAVCGPIAAQRPAPALLPPTITAFARGRRGGLGPVHGKPHLLGAGLAVHCFFLAGRALSVRNQN